MDKTILQTIDKYTPKTNVNGATLASNQAI